MTDDVDVTDAHEPTTDAGQTGAPPALHTPPLLRSMWRGPARRALLAAIAGGLAFDLLARRGAATVSGTFALAVLVAGTACAAPIRRAGARVALGGALVFALWPMLRASPWLGPLDLTAVVLLVVLAVALERAPTLRAVGFVDVGWSWCAAFVTACCSPFHVATLVAANAPEPGAVSRSRAQAVGRGVLLAAPVVVAVTWLLASADGVFRSFVVPPLDGEDVVAHVLLVLVGACVAIVPVVRARSAATSPAVRVRLARADAAVVLGALVGLYALFALSQATALVRGDAYVQRATGLTYAEYARRGYFQLLVVASITALVLLVVRAGTADEHGAVARHVRLLAATAAVLTIVIVASALRRLSLYDAALGFTVLRLACTVFAVWMAVVFLVLAVSAVRPGASRHDGVPVVLVATAFATLLVWNAINPEAYVARHNLDRAADGASLDVAYLASLRADATPTIVSALDALAPEQRDRLLTRLCTADALASRPLLEANVAHAHAADALRAVCPGR